MKDEYFPTSQLTIHYSQFTIQQENPMLLQIEEVIAATPLQLAGAAGFGMLIGWYPPQHLPAQMVGAALWQYRSPHPEGTCGWRGA